MKRDGASLERQAREFLYNMGVAESLDFIITIDPVFAEFMKVECGVNLDAIKQLSTLAMIASAGLKRNIDIVTEENCTKFLIAKGELP